ncbi:MAG: hypothetical protein KAX40_11820 [Herpetosiphon sp.]|nr:hypothetical protein [Herpetosiphon sp.]
MQTTLDTVFEYIEKEASRDILLANAVELKHAKKVCEFIAQVAAQHGDDNNQRRFRDLVATIERIEVRS